MKQNYAKSLEMQIPQENAYTGLNIMPIDEEFDKLSKYYTINNIEQVTNFIKEHDALLDYIKSITPLISNYFPNNEKIIDFCEDPEFDSLDFIMIYIKSSNLDKDWETLQKLEHERITAIRIPKNIIGLISLDLW